MVQVPIDVPLEVLQPDGTLRRLTEEDIRGPAGPEGPPGSGGGGGGSAGPASSSALGSVKITGTAVDPANPIAPGDNDARLSDQRIPTDGSVSNAKVASTAGIVRTTQGPLAVYGHSINVSGAPAANPQLTAERMHTDVLLHAIPASALSIAPGFGYGFGGGGWEHVYRMSVEHPRGPVQFWGVANDLALGNTTAWLAPVGLALEACLSRVQNSGVRESQDASVSYPDGGYTQGFSPGVGGGLLVRPGVATTASGAEYAYTPTNGKRVQIAVPATHNGQIAVGFATQDGGSGAVWDVKVDGTSVGTIDTRNVNAMVPQYTSTATVTSGSNTLTAVSPAPVTGWMGTQVRGAGIPPNTWPTAVSGSTVTMNNNATASGTGVTVKAGTPFATPSVKRITGLSAGTHTVVLTPSSIQGSAQFDCWWTEETDQQVAVPLDYHNNGGNPDADIDVLNGIVTSVVAGFGPNVFAVPTNDIMQVNFPARFNDVIHPNQVGHEAISERVYSYFLARQQAVGAAAGAETPSGVGRWPFRTDRNTIHSQAGSTPLTLKASSSFVAQTADMLSVRDGSANPMFGIAADGRVRYGPGGQCMRPVTQRQGVSSVGFFLTSHTAGMFVGVSHQIPPVTFTASTTNGSAVLTNVSPTPTVDMIYRAIGGPGLSTVMPFITAVSGTTITLNAPATATATGVTVFLGPHMTFTYLGYYNATVWMAPPTYYPDTSTTVMVAAYGANIADGSAPANGTSAYFAWTAIG